MKMEKVETWSKIQINIIHTEGIIWNEKVFIMALFTIQGFGNNLSGDRKMLINNMMEYYADNKTDVYEEHVITWVNVGVIKYIELRQNLKFYSEYYFNYKNNGRKKASKKLDGVVMLIFLPTFIFYFI